MFPPLAIILTSTEFWLSGKTATPPPPPKKNKYIRTEITGRPAPTPHCPPLASYVCAIPARK